MSKKDWIWLFFLGGIWGTSFVFNEILIRELKPIWVSAGRVTIGAAGCWAFYFIYRISHPKVVIPKHYYPHFVIFGALSYAIPFSLFPLSQEYLASGVAAILNAVTPITTIIVSHFWVGGERASRKKTLGVMIGFVGVLTLTLPSISSKEHSQIWAIIGCMLATLCYATGLNYAQFFKGIPPTVLAACSLSGASVIAIPFAYITGGVPVIRSVDAWISLLGISLVATAFAFQVMYHLLPRVGATNFSAVTFIAPISAIVLGFSLLNERLRVEHVLGMSIIFLGLVLIDGKLLKRILRK